MKTNKNKKVARHGDWNLIETTEKLVGKLLKHGTEFTWSEGEATNHFHTIVAKKPADFEIVKTDYGYMLEVKKTVKATHPEHSLKGDMVIKPGTYKLKQPREFDWIQQISRKVID